MTEQGWISIHRQLKNHWVWQDPVKLKWWLDILLSVNHTPNKVNLGNQIVECGRGQSLKSLQTWAYEWKTSKDNVRNFFKLLEKDKMISTENVIKSTRLTVCNYDSYQSNLHATPTQHQRTTNATPTQSHPNNNEDNSNNEITILGAGVPPTPVGAVSFEDKYKWLVEKFNNLTGKKSRGCKPSKTGFQARLKDGYTGNDFIQAIQNCLSDKFHKDNPKYLTLEFITRSDKLEMYLNASTGKQIVMIPDKEFQPGEVASLFGNLKPEFQ